MRVPHSESGKKRRRYVLAKFGSNPNNPTGKLSKGLKGGSEPIFLPEEPNHLGKNPGDVWTIPTQPFPEAHFATYPEKLIEPMIKAGCPSDGIVLDPFIGSGTTAVVAERLNRKWIGIEKNEEYCKIAERRLSKWKGQRRLV